ncbi:hypothetical protein WMF26_48385 [Sorangium sp. So ce185]|uniref:hypothetical protein n=1 Tax=Sorangium sp. So ce185 TaxID=3133287 RepID=UPI003F5E8AFC
MSITPPDPHSALKALRALLVEVDALIKVSPDAELLAATRETLAGAEADLTRFVAQKQA